MVATGSGPLAPGDVVGRYRVDRRLDGGGFADVYLAHHHVLGTPVALKVPRTAELHRAWLREARLQSHLEHANIVRLLDVLDHGGAPVLVMEYVHGCPLSSAVRNDQLPEAEVPRVVRLVARAVAHAHALRVVHLDLKPANVLLFRDGEQLSLKVCDFGLARVRTAAAPLTGQRWAGTPAYMAPEQFGGPVDARADVYALGCLIYELLAGDRPFRGAWLDIGLRKQAGAYRPLTDLRPALEHESRVVDRCLRPDPAERYADARELLRDWSPTGRTNPRRGLSFLPARAPLSRTPVPESLVRAPSSATPSVG